MKTYKFISRLKRVIIINILVNLFVWFLLENIGFGFLFVCLWIEFFKKNVSNIFLIEVLYKFNNIYEVIV